MRVKVSDKDGQRTEDERLCIFADETLEVSDDEPVALWRREPVEEGARLEFGKVRCGG